MPDRVKVPRSIPRPYKSIYKQVCELQSPTSVASSAVQKIKKDIRKLGHSGEQLISDVSDHLELVKKDSLVRRMPNCWDEVHEKIDSTSHKVNGIRTFTMLAENACRQIANRLEQGEQVENIKFELEKQYFLNVWASRFVARVPLQYEHYTDVDDEILKEHIDLVSLRIEQEVENLLHGIKPAPLDSDELLEIDIMQDEL